MDITRMQAINRSTGRPLASAPNQFQHIREYPGADFRAVVRPNFDTLYSSVWLDLTDEPMVVAAPDTDVSRSARRIEIRSYRELCATGGTGSDDTA